MLNVLRTAKGLTASCVVGIAIVVGIACNPFVDAELDQAVRAVGGMTQADRLSQSCYSVLFPNGKPSQFVSYIFSTVGVSEWPLTEKGVFADDIELEKAWIPRKPLLPKTVPIVQNKRDPQLKKQLVITFDDEAGYVITEGYLEGQDKPAIIKKWQIPSVTPQTGVSEMCQPKPKLGIQALFG